jgi:hypothetical protein
MWLRIIFLTCICTLTLAGLTGCDGDDNNDHADLVILTEQLPNGRVGVAYGFVLEVAGDADEFLLVSGTLPPGIAFSIDGVFSGIPTEAGSFVFTVEAIDFSGGFIVARTSKGFSLIIEP